MASRPRFRNEDEEREYWATPDSVGEVDWSNARRASPGSGSSPDPAVVAALVGGRDRFLAFLERRLGDRAEAEEVLQSALVRALERGGAVREHERATAWFFRVLRNALADRRRARAAEARGLQSLAAEADERAEAAIEGEVCRCFEALLPAMRPGQAELIRRVDLEGERPADLAREEGITANNAMVRLHRARRELRRRLIETCRTCAEHGCLDCSCGRPARSGQRV